VADDIRTLHLTKRELGPSLEYGYPDPDDAAMLRASKVQNGVHVEHIRRGGGSCGPRRCSSQRCSVQRASPDRDWTRPARNVAVRRASRVYGGGAHRRHGPPQLLRRRRRYCGCALGDGSINILALSGGGAGGAFGAGILVGLSHAGTRPQYEIVTGVSTGALLAPFAFLGPDWDAQLVQAYGGDASSDLMHRFRLTAMFRTALYNGQPLRDLVNRFATDDLIAAIAREAGKGRLLLVATTNLDREEIVIWNLGNIAAEGGAHARSLFVYVLVASASTPGVFPPVMIEVRDGADTFQEMHVDGGASAPFFIAPNLVLALGNVPDALHDANLYVISNGQLGGGASRTTPVNAISIISRSLTAMMNHMTRAALAQVAPAQRGSTSHDRPCPQLQ